MRQYETSFLIAPNLPEEDNKKLISQMAEIISKKKGKMVNVDEWGKRKLAYPIHKFEEAYYVFFLYEGDSSIPLELERRFRQTETIIRYLTVRNEIKDSAKKRGKLSSRKKKGAARGKEEKGPAEETPKEEIGEEQIAESKIKEESSKTQKPDLEAGPREEQGREPELKDKSTETAEKKAPEDGPAEGREKEEK